MALADVGDGRPRHRPRTDGHAHDRSVWLDGICGDRRVVSLCGNVRPSGRVNGEEEPGNAYSHEAARTGHCWVNDTDEDLVWQSINNQPTEGETKVRAEAEDE